MGIRGSVSSKMVRIDAYTDHVVIISRNLRALEEALKEFGNKTQETGLIFNQEKTKYMRLIKNATAIGGYRFESL